MKKFLPVILFVIGLAVVGGVFLFMRGGGEPQVLDDASIPDLPAEQRPFASLTPSDDGHFLTMVVENINVPSADSMEYELLYQVADGRTQGVPGKVPISSGDSLERELLLGSESSGKFRFDEGVETGKLTLRFRDGNGKLIGKAVTDFHLQTETDLLTSVDGIFEYALDETSQEGEWFVTMMTFQPKDLENIFGEYGIFSSSGGLPSGEANPQ